MDRAARIYVAGHRGLVGSALLRSLRAAGYSNLITKTHQELDLTDRAATRDFFLREQPEYVLVAAARVGGILANDTYPAEFIYENLMISANVIHESWRARVRRLLYLGSSCIYPRDCPQPIKENSFLTGALEQTNRAYAVAKISGVEACWSYNRQHGTSFLAAMPTNLYGPGDNYDLGTSHVVPALIRKFHEARMHGAASVDVWGTGRPRREFLHSDDAANACLFLLNLPEDRFSALCRGSSEPPLINIGCGVDQTIEGLARLIGKVVGFDGRIHFDAGKPDGTPRKLLDVQRLNDLGWKPTIALETGIRLAYEDFRNSARA